MAAALVVAGLASLGAARPQGAAVSEGDHVARHSAKAGQTVRHAPSETCRSATCQGGDAHAYVGGSDLLPEQVTRPACGDARRGLAYYESRRRDWRTRMGADLGGRGTVAGSPGSDDAQHIGLRACPHIRLLAKRARARAHSARLAYLAWWHEQYAWWDWLPQPYRAIFQCENPQGNEGINWRANSGTYQGGPGFYYRTWDAYKPQGYPGEAYQASPREQFVVAQIVARAVGLGAWGCYSHGGYRYHLP